VDCSPHFVRKAIPLGETPSKKAVLPVAKPALFFCTLFKASFDRFQKNKAALFRAAFFEGWKMGFEPTTFGTTIRRSNQLNYIHRFRFAK
jgi:hypothetical protein